MAALRTLAVAIGLALAVMLATGCTPPALEPLPEVADQAYTDAWIVRQVTIRLNDDLELHKFLIHVQATDSIVYLQGTVPSDALRKRAGDIARGSPYVWGVHNNISLARTLPPGEHP